MPVVAQNRRRRPWSAAASVLLASAGCTVPLSVVKDAGWQPEQQALAVRDPAALPPAPIPNVPPPVTVADEKPATVEQPLSLNEVVRISLENSKAIRVFTGLGATNSGRTIYDTAIANTAIDQQQARFDPAMTAGLTHNRTDDPLASAVFASPFGIGLFGGRGDDTRASVGLTKVNTLGGQVGLNFVGDRVSQSPSIVGLNPADTRAVELNLTQPLLRGGGFQFNTAPIVLARIDTERSYFQFKDATQELVRGTIEAYWNVVFARVDLWARENQLRLSKFTFDLAEASRVVGRGGLPEVAQAEVQLTQFQAAVVVARADLLTREAALRNVIGLPPSDGRQLVPMSALTDQHYVPDWDKLLRFASERRPDLIELKLVLEADGTRRVQAANAALPQLDANALYRWNGLSGRLPPTGTRFSSDPGQFADWSVGVTFSVPLGLRQGRAQVREQDLTILRDKANLEQGLHAAVHDLATTVRALESSYAQYQAYLKSRAAAERNLAAQLEIFRNGRTIFLNVLQAINDWGTAISSEARALADYNVLLATLERQTGTILETHGLVFLEERFQAVGPLCHVEHMREYSRDLKPSGEPTRYPATDRPGENLFDLKRPEDIRKGERPPSELPVPKFADDRAKDQVGPPAPAKLGQPERKPNGRD
jgi:outer membrane protein TolC